jgi:signal peptidase I
MVAPRFLGYQVLNVVSGSMEPEIPIGSLVLVGSAEPAQIEVDDIIAYRSGDSVITHRVVENHTVEGEFITKGDANDENDLTPISYSDYEGKVVFHAPMLGDFMTMMSSTVGKIYLLAFVLCGLMFNILAGRLRARAREELVEEEIRKQEM